MSKASLIIIIIFITLITLELNCFFQKESGVNSTKRALIFFLIHIDMAIKASLRAHNKFHVTSTAEFLRKLRILFH